MKRVSDLCHHIVSSFGLKSGVYLTLEDYTLPPCENLKNVIFPQDVIQVHSTNKAIASCKREREESIISSSSSSSDESSDCVQTKPKPQSKENQIKQQVIKRPLKILKETIQQEDGNSTDSNTYVNLIDIEQIDPSKHVVASGYQGIRLKFDQQNQEANQTNSQSKQEVIQLNIKSPAQEFAAKKAQWKIKPFGKKKNNTQQKKRKLNEQDNVMNKKEEIQNDFNGYSQLTQQEIPSFKPEIGQQILIKVSETVQNSQSVQCLQLKKAEIKQVQEQMIVVVFESTENQNETKIQLNEISELWLRQKEEIKNLQQVQALKELESQTEVINQQTIQMQCQETENQINQPEKNNYEYQAQTSDPIKQVEILQQQNEKLDNPLVTAIQQSNTESSQLQEKQSVNNPEQDISSSNNQIDNQNISKDQQVNSAAIDQQDPK